MPKHGQVLHENLIGRNLVPYPVPCGSIKFIPNLRYSAPWTCQTCSFRKSVEFMFLHQSIFDLVRFDLNVGISMPYTL